MLPVREVDPHCWPHDLTPFYCGLHRQVATSVTNLLDNGGGSVQPHSPAQLAVNLRIPRTEDELADKGHPFTASASLATNIDRRDALAKYSELQVVLVTFQLDLHAHKRLFAPAWRPPAHPSAPHRHRIYTALMATKIAVLSQKGGTGKTTAVRHLDE